MMLANARYRAKQDGVPFNITKEDIAIPERCPVTDVKIGIDVGNKGGGDCSPSLDRLDPSAGYVPGNITVVSNKANRLKSQLSPEQLLVFARAYYQHAQQVKENHLAAN